MKIDRWNWNTLRRYHVEGGAIVIVCRTPHGRIVSMTPASIPQINVRVHPIVAAHYIAKQRREERQATRASSSAFA